MNRRSVVLGAGIALAGVLRARPLPVLAQDSDDSARPEPTPWDLYRYQDLWTQAERNFEHRNMEREDGAAQLNTHAFIFDDEASARVGFLHQIGLLDFLIERGELDVMHQAMVTPPRLGNETMAEKAIFEFDDLVFFTTVLSAYEGRTLHVWYCFGLGDPTEELFEIAEQTMRFHPVDERDDEEVLGLLPTDDELPDGFRLVLEEVTPTR